MANTNAPFGLRLLERQNDATPSFGQGMDPLKIAPGDANKLAKGDPLIRLGTGFVTRATAGIAASQWVGVFNGCQYLSASQGKRIVSSFWNGGDVAAGDVDCLYIPLMGFPNARFVIQGVGAPYAFADIGQNYDIVAAAPTIYGSWGKSNFTLAAPPGAVTATLPFRLVGLWSQYVGRNSRGTVPGTDDTSNFNWAVVEFNGNQETGLA